MSRKSAPRFCANDMPQNKNLKRVARVRSNATRFKLAGGAGQRSIAATSRSIRRNPSACEGTMGG
ncbi:hypothetical protein C9427_17925 [Mesorhizobium helmanticense]|uniref:Uncharacterized protein n=1 Tax=Mesorhizobium helmanticense TaxID=1776423 RepID=A0A2T4ITT6_9HYPH|nr:hypothetical protein C9427_17925 [Mesorhizobium helmanticense]